VKTRVSGPASGVLAWRRAGFKIIATGLQQCSLTGDGGTEADRIQLEKLFLA